MNAKRRTREQQAVPRPPTDVGPAERWPELQAILDEELERLPVKYRAAVLLCDLEGKTHREAARLLGWPDGTLTTRLIAARRLLAGLLTRRGVTLTAGAIAALLAQQAAPAAVPAALAETTAAAATGTVFSTQVVLLTEGVLKAMLIAKLKTTAGMVLGLALLGAVAGGVAYPGDGPADNAPVQSNAAPQQAAGAAPADNGARQHTRHGVVTKVVRDMVITSLGRDDGVVNGDRLEIYRLKPRPVHLGHATVTDASARDSIAYVKPGTRVRVGDVVAVDVPRDRGVAPPMPPPTVEGAAKAGFGSPPAAPPLPDPQQVNPPPDRKGTVIRVSETDLVQISLGTDDGIAKGDRVIIYRLKPKPYFLGRATVLETRPHESVVSVPASRARVEVGDQVTKDEFVPPGKAPPPAEQLGVVSRIDAGNNVVEVSLGSDDGIKEGQMLHVWHLTPKTAYFGKIKVIATFQRSAVARPTDAAILKSLTAGDKVSVHPPTWPSEPREAPSQPQAGAMKVLSARQVAERFLSAAVAGKMTEVRYWAQPVPKNVVAALKDNKKTPTVALVQVDSDDGLVISGPIEHPVVTDGIFIGTARRDSPQAQDVEWRAARLGDLGRD